MTVCATCAAKDQESRRLERRIARLETVLRVLHAANEGEVEQAFSNSLIEDLFTCPACLDSGIAGYRRSDGAPLACTACAPEARR